MKSRHCPVCQPVRISACRLSAMLWFPGGALPPGLKRPRLALLMIETLVWASRYIRLMYWPRWNSPASVVGGPGFGGGAGLGCGRVHGRQALPRAATPDRVPPFVVALAVEPLAGVPR